VKRALVFSMLAALACGVPIAAAEIAFKLPPPDLARLVPLAALPLDKPAVAVPPVAPPPPTPGLPELPPPRLLSDIAHRPVAPMPAPRVLACNPVGTLFGVGSELVECGRARYQKGELEAARTAFQSAAQGSSDRAVMREARYWLGETQLRLGQGADTQRLFSMVAQDDPKGEFAPFAIHELGWIALDGDEPTVALGHFDSLLKGRMPAVLIPYARHGRALALYGLKRHGEARDEWVALLADRSTPRPLSVEVTFWLGDALGRLGDSKGAVARLQAFSGSGSRFLAENGLLSLGWWSRANAQPAEAVKAYRRLLASYPQAATQGLWARAGLVQALLDQGDFATARDEVKRLEALNKAGTLVLPSLLSLRRFAAEKGKADDARALDTDLLARSLDPGTRGWVLLLSAELARQSGNAGEARDRLDLVRGSLVTAAVKQQADFRAAQLDFDARDFARAQSGAQGVLGEPVADDLRAATMVLAAESAYWARDYEQAAALYTRFLAEFSGRPEAPSVGLALGWAEFRRGNQDAARQRWTAFAREAPSDPRAGETLLLAAELTAKSGDAAQARVLLDRVVGQYPGTEQADVAVLNRAILSVDAGRPADALAELGRLGPRASASPDLARARVVRGIALLGSGRDGPAESELKSALGQGDDGICHLGLGVIAFNRRQWESAAREFTEARDGGGARVSAAADYGLAAVAFNQGNLGEFKKIAGGLLDGPNDPSTTPELLHGMEAVAVEEKRWPDARVLTLRLVDQFPSNAAAPAALAEVGAAAGASAEWPLARDMYRMLAARYPTSAGRQAGRIVYAEALLRSGGAADARRELEALAAALPPGNSGRARLLPLLAEAQEATGDRAAAAKTYASFAAEYPGEQGAPAMELGVGRLLQVDGKWSEARPHFERALKDGDSAVVPEAAYRLGEGLREAGQHDQAIEAYMSAAYLAPDSTWGRRALLGAGRSFAALKQSDAAVIVYRKLLASSSVEPDLATEAKTSLKALGAN
jgi:TolA-binding protein